MNLLMSFPLNTLPPDGLEFFYCLSLWVETNKQTKLTRWGMKCNKLSTLKIARPNRGKRLTAPKELADNTLYFPTCNFGAKDVLIQIRNAFCHASISYVKDTEQYIIRKNDKTSLEASFSLEAIDELSIFFK